MVHGAEDWVDRRPGAPTPQPVRAAAAVVGGADTLAVPAASAGTAVYPIAVALYMKGLV